MHPQFSGTDVNKKNRKRENCPENESRKHLLIIQKLNFFSHQIIRLQK